MMNRMVQVLSVLGVLAAAGCNSNRLTGPTALQPVPGGAAVAVSASPEEVARATKLAMVNLQISVVSSQADKMDATVVGQAARDSKVTVMASGGGNRTQLIVDAGGDKAMASKLIEEIRNQLAVGEQPTFAGDRD